MRVLAYPHATTIGGAQIAAVELLLALRRRGHEVTVLAPDGPLVSALQTGGLGWIRCAPLSPHPVSLDHTRTLAAAIRATRPDVVHAFEIGHVLAAFRVARVGFGLPVLGSFFSTRIPWFVPESIPLTAGKPVLLDFTVQWRTAPCRLLEPAVDIRPPPPGPAGGELRARLGIAPHAPVVTLVSRFTQLYKGEGLIGLVKSFRALDPELGTVALLVGDGPLHAELAARARAVNRALGRTAVVLPGPMPDPAPAYAVADVVAGNGHGLLRGMALGKAGVVLGRMGFCRTATPERTEALAHEGFYGTGDGGAMADAVTRELSPLLRDPDARARLGAFAARYVAERYGADRGAERLEEALEDARRGPRSRAAGEWVRAMGRAVHYRLRQPGLRREARRRGLQGEEAVELVFGRLRDMALPGGRRWTGRNLRAPAELASRAGRGA
jgi:glycosyltransferase involved in cell wall biosynthesis